MKLRIWCQNPDCDLAMPRLNLGFCAFCGTAQVNSPAPHGDVDDDGGEDVAEASRAGAIPAGWRSVAAPHGAGMADDPVANLAAYAAAEVRGTYCDAATFAALVAYGVRVCGMPESRARTVLAMQLESSHTVNERDLIDELDGLLHNFTDHDKKLDDKERMDAVDNACRPRPGYTRGMDRVEAERYVVDFCRRHGVKVKSGWLRWAIP